MTMTSARVVRATSTMSAVRGGVDPGGGEAAAVVEGGDHGLGPLQGDVGQDEAIEEVRRWAIAAIDDPTPPAPITTMFMTRITPVSRTD